MKGPWRVLSVEGSLHIFHFLWPDPNENNYWLYFCILCNKNGIKGLWGDKGRPHWVQDPPWSFNGPYHGPTIHQTWPFIYWLYFCILCNKNGVKGHWGHKGPPWPTIVNLAFCTLPTFLEAFLWLPIADTSTLRLGTR